MSYSKVVQVGASGAVGTPILKALVESGKFEVTVLARESSSYTSPYTSVRTRRLDLHNHDALVAALRGVDAVVLTIGDMAALETNTKPIIDAAIAAGVKRLIPSSFGNDLANSPGRQQFLYTPKINVETYLEEKAAAGEIEYTSVANGPFFDWGLKYNFIGFDIPNHKVKLFDDGNAKFITTSLDSVAQSVVAILSNPAETKNRQVRIHDFLITQNEILTELESLTRTKFAIQTIESDKLEKETTAGLQRGEWTPENIYGLIQAYVFGKNTSAKWEEDDDSELLGLKKKSLREELQKSL